METTPNIRPARDNITLIGMPAVGKSTVGILLAKRLGFAFIDTDLLIQSGEGRRLHQIIQTQGIQKFCAIESKYVCQLNTQRTVVATGGSVIYVPEAMVHLQTLGRLLFLDIELAELKKRLDSLDTRGVVHMPGQTVDALYAQRRPMYQGYAHVSIDCTHDTPETLVTKIIRVLRRDPLFAFSS